jgi:outer membrane protein OmpA-like peptidoglycan-associated protein
LERALAERGRADIYSIHFSFNSDRIRDESEPTLKEIAGLLAMHPEWKLSIEGHTDDIGGDGSNLDLSRRRSAAVKAALVAKYKIDGNRLSTGGFGKSRPKDTNETLEGRARNRRVELVRQ